LCWFALINQWVPTGRSEKGIRPFTIACLYRMDNPNRHLLALAAGIIGGLIPNKHSNVHPMLMGFVLAILLTKVLYGDYDKGFQFTFSDILFLIVVGGEGILGAYITGFNKKS